MATVLNGGWQCIASAWGDWSSSNGRIYGTQRIYAYVDNIGRGTCTVHLKYTFQPGLNFTGTWGNYGGVYINDAQHSSAWIGTRKWDGTANEYQVGDEWTINVAENNGYTGGVSAWTVYAWYGINQGNSTIYGEFTVYTAPRNLRYSDVTTGIDWVRANVKIDGWGGAGDANSRYRELQVWTYSSSGLVTPRRYQPAYGNSTTGNITCNNSSRGDLTITGNTRYVVGIYASNGTYATGSDRKDVVVTKPPVTTYSLNTAHPTEIILNYNTPADGGYYTKYLEYSLDGTNWVTAKTISGGTAQNSTFTITGLTPNTDYTIRTRVRTSEGTTTCATLTVHTLDPVPSGYTLTVANRDSVAPPSVESETQTITWGVATWGETATSGTVTLYASTDQTNWTQLDSKTSTGTYTYVRESLLFNETYYYKVVAVNNIPKTTESDVVSQTTLPYKISPSISWDYNTYNTVNVYIRAVYNGKAQALPADIKYKLTYNGTTTGWITARTGVNPSTNTGYLCDTAVLPTETNYRVDFEVSTSAGAIQTSFSSTTANTHQGPTGVAYDIIDGNTALQTWLSSFDGYDGLIRINGKSQTGVRVTNSGTCSHSATLASGSARLNIEPVTLDWTSDWTNVDRYFGNPTPTKFYSDLGFGTGTVTVNITDSLGAVTTVTKNYTAAYYEEPTINGSAERLNVQGNLLVRIYGAYTRLWFGNAINYGEDCNNITFEYRVMNYDGTVKQDWTEITRFTTEIDSQKTYLRNYEGSVTLTDVDYLNSFTVEVRITDHFGSYEGVVPVDVWDAERVLYPPEYDVELWDWKTNSFVADISYLVVGDLNIDWTLNDVEQVSFEIDLEQFEEKCADMNVDSTELLQPYSHDIRIRRNGVYIVGCQLVEANVQVSNDPPSKIQIKGTGYLNLFKDQYIMNEAWGSYTYSEIARRLIVEAQQPDCLVKNPTCDIDVGYWLANNGTVSYDTNAYAGDGCLVARTTGSAVAVGTEMNCKSGDNIEVDVWVKGNKGALLEVSERLYITQYVNEIQIGKYRLNGNWQHLVIPFIATYDNSYIAFRLETSNLALYIDECYVYARDDSSTFSNLGVVLGEDTATAVQSKTRQADFSLQNVKDALMELTSMEEDNFDFDFSYDRKFNVYEKKGHDRTNLEISYPGNIHSMSVARSAASLYNKITNIGSGVGDERMQVVVENIDSQQKYGTRELVATNSNVSLEETLIGQAVGALYDSKDPTDLPTITIKDGSINPFNLQVGDTICPIVESDDYLNTIEGIYRVAKISLSVEEDGIEGMKLTLEPEAERPQKKTIRYIRDSINGNTTNDSNHWVQVEALVLVGNEYVNIAQGATVTSSVTSSISGHSDPNIVTNGNLDSENYYDDGGTSTSGGNPVAITVDLGDEYPVDYVKVWHYYSDGRKYKNNVCSVGNTLPANATDPLETVLWKTTAQTSVNYPDATRAETGAGRKSGWLQDSAVKGEMKKQKTIRYIKDTMERPTYLNSSGDSTIYAYCIWSLIQAFVKNENGDWVDVAYGTTGDVYVDNNPRASTAYATRGTLGTYTYWSLNDGQKGSIIIDLGAEYPVEYIRIWHFASQSAFRESAPIATNNTLSVGSTKVINQTPLDYIVWEEQNVSESVAGLCSPNIQGVLKQSDSA